jgi:uncharacterized membrane protein
MSKAVFCLARDREHASNIVDQLKNAGFPNTDISVLMADKAGSREFAHEKETKAPEGAVTGALTGGAVGGVLGWLLGIGALSIPGLGPFIAAGPIMAALSGTAVGAAAGGITGALIGMGIPEYEAKRYEKNVKEGKVIVSVHADDGEEVRRAKEIFERAGAEDIATAEEESSAKRAEQKTTAGRATVATAAATTPNRSSAFGAGVRDQKEREARGNNASDDDCGCGS